jgi:hypothetical protein
MVGRFVFAGICLFFLIRYWSQPHVTRYILLAVGAGFFMLGTRIQMQNRRKQRRRGTETQS